MDNNNLLLKQNKLKTFFSLIFMGYFGIKIFNGSLISKNHFNSCAIFWRTFPTYFVRPIASETTLNM